MLQPVSKLFQREGSAPLDEIDIRHFIERYLKKELATQEIVCERLKDGQAVVRVPSALLRQEVYLLEYDMALLLKKEANYTLKGIRVTQQ
jgi:hypothetical protein